MLSNCKDCQFYSSPNDKVVACAVHPKYWEMFKLLVNAISYEILSEHDAILACPDFQISEELQEKTVKLTLTFREWKQIVGSSRKSNLSDKIISQIREALDMSEPERLETDDIPF